MSGRSADSITLDIERSIVAGELEEGRPLPAERALMEQYGASRTVIREAITALTAKGFLKSRPRYRPIVCRPDASSAMQAAGGVIKHLLDNSRGVHDLYQVRVLFERVLVRDAATGAGKWLEDDRSTRARKKARLRDCGSPAIFCLALLCQATHMFGMCVGTTSQNPPASF